MIQQWWKILTQRWAPNLNVKVREGVEEEVLEERGVWMMDKTTKQRKKALLWEGEPHWGRLLQEKN